MLPKSVGSVGVIVVDRITIVTGSPWGTPETPLIFIVDLLL